jgi:hypothetical protein
MPKTMSINNSATISPPPVVSAFQRASKSPYPIGAGCKALEPLTLTCAGCGRAPWVIPQGAFRVAQWATA